MGFGFALIVGHLKLQIEALSRLTAAGLPIVKIYPHGRHDRRKSHPAGHPW